MINMRQFCPVCPHTSWNISWNVLAPFWVRSLQRSFLYLELHLLLWKTKDRVSSRLHIRVSQIYLIERTKFGRCKFKFQEENTFIYLKKKRPCMFQATHPSQWNLPHWKNKFAISKFYFPKYNKYVKWRHILKYFKTEYLKTHSSFTCNGETWLESNSLGGPVSWLVNFLFIFNLLQGIFWTCLCKSVYRKDEVWLYCIFNPVIGIVLLKDYMPWTISPPPLPRLSNLLYEL